MNYDYCTGCETPDNCRWCPSNKSKDRCGFCGRELSTEQAVRTGRLWKELADTKKKLDIAVKRLEDIVLDAEILATPEYLASRAKETLEQIKK